MKIVIKNAGTLEKIIKEVLTETTAQWGEGGVNITLDKCDEGVKIVSDGKNITLLYSQTASLFRGLGIIVSKGETAYEITQKMKLKQLGNMLDCSSGGMMKVEKVKQFLRITALMGYNMLQLYTEDTYEIVGEPYFGRLRGRYTKSELKEIDDYAYSLGVEVIPCIQTLAHLNCIFNWPEYKNIRDIDNILNVGVERSLELIEKMFKTMSECFRSRQINIGMDEAHNLGRGRYLDMFGYKSKAELMKEHLMRIIVLCRKYGYEPMMWSDMFFRICSPNDAYDNKVELTKEVIDSVPEGVNLVYWDYYREDPDYYREMFNKHRQFKNKFSFAGGSSTWYGYSPMQKFSMITLRAAFEAIKDYEDLDTVLVTHWGASTSMFSALPTLAAYGAGAWTGDLSDEAVTTEMAVIGADFEDFMNLSCFSVIPSLNIYSKHYHCYMLYGDVLQGVWDCNIPDGMNKVFADAVPKLEKGTENEKWGYIFAPLEKLAKALAQKAEFGKDLKAAYDCNDREELYRLANAVIPSMCEQLNKFSSLHAKRWRIDNKDFGIESDIIKIGGLVARLEYTAGLINEYLNGECDKIDELEEERLSIDKGVPVGNPVNFGTWTSIITKGRIF